MSLKKHLDAIDSLRNELSELAARPVSVESIDAAFAARFADGYLCTLDEWINGKARVAVTDPEYAADLTSDSCRSEAMVVRLAAGLFADTIRENIVARAAELIAQTGLPPIDQAERARLSLELRRRIYAAELELSGACHERGEKPPSGINAAAWLLVPLGVAEDAGLLGHE